MNKGELGTIYSFRGSKMYPFKYHNPETGTLRQFLVELVMYRKAKKEGIILAKGFWSDPVWKLEYAQQIAAASQLVKVFGEQNGQIIIDSIGELNWLTSLRAKQLKEKIYQKIAEKEAKAQREKDLVAPKEEVSVEVKEVSGVRRKQKVERNDL